MSRYFDSSDPAVRYAKETTADWVGVKSIRGIRIEKAAKEKVLRDGLYDHDPNSLIGIGLCKFATYRELYSDLVKIDAVLRVAGTDRTIQVQLDANDHGDVQAPYFGFEEIM